MNQRYIPIRALQATAVFLFFLALAVAGSWPLVTHLSTHIPDHFDDAALHMWNTWWVGKALSGGGPVFYTDRIFYPYGVSLLTQNFAWFHLLPALLLSPFLNEIAAFNTAVLLNLALCGSVMFWVAYKLVGDARAALIAGLIYQMWPYRMARLDLPNMLATYCIPLFLYFLIRALQNGRRRDALLSGLFLALTGYGRWQFLIPAAIMGLIILVFGLLAPDSAARRERLRNLAGGALLAALLLLPPALLLLSDASSRGNLSRGNDEEVLMSADLLAFVTPSQLHPVLNERTESLHDRYYFDREALRRRPSFIGFVPLLLVVAGIYFQRRRAWPWVVMALVLILLALGPTLRLGGVLYEGIPTLYGLLSPVHILELMRNPERFALFVALPMAILAAYGVAGLLENSTRLNRFAWPVTGVLGALIFFEYFSPQVVLRDRAHWSPIYDELAALPGEFALLNLPFDNIKARAYMGEQLIHQRAIVQGSISRTPAAADRYVDENAFLSTLDVSGEMAPQFADVSRQMAHLADDGIDYLIMHKDKVGSDRIAHWQRYLIAEPRYEDATRVAYSTAAQAGSDFTLPAGWTAGPAPVAVTVSSTCVHPNHVLAVDAGWGTDGPITGDLAVELALVDGDGNARHSATFVLVDGWPSRDWPADTLAWGHYKLDLPGDLPPGLYDLSLRLRSLEDGSPQGASHVVEQIRVQEPICNLAAQPDTVAANVLYGDELRLVEYTAVQEDGRLDLHLYWRGERLIEQDYTVFVHVFDRQTAVPVTQHDGLVRGGAYPMRYWWPGDVVDERVRIALDGVPSGEYGIAIGVYDAANGERLPILNERGLPAVDDGRFVLPQTVVIP